MADVLLAHERGGDYNGIPDADFASLLTRQLRELSGDPHLEVIYSQTVLPPQPRADPTPAEDARYREQMLESNCTKSICPIRSRQKTRLCIFLAMQQC
jgi:hypothetical protein